MHCLHVQFLKWCTTIKKKLRRLDTGMTVSHTCTRYLSQFCPSAHLMQGFSVHPPLLPFGWQPRPSHQGSHSPASNQSAQHKDSCSLHTGCQTVLAALCASSDKVHLKENRLSVGSGGSSQWAWLCSYAVDFLLSRLSCEIQEDNIWLCGRELQTHFCYCGNDQ